MRSKYGYAYGPYSLGKTLTEPLSAAGDYDGDGLTNVQEYETVLAVGGDAALYAEVASNPSPFWHGNPALPAFGGAAVALLFGGIAAVAARAIRHIG